MLEPERRWNQAEINKYCNSRGWNAAESKAAVIKQLATYSRIDAYLATIDGAIMMDSVVESVRNHVMKIVHLSVESFDKNIDEIRASAMRIAAAEEFMYSLLTTLDLGRQHDEGISSLQGDK